MVYSVAQAVELGRAHPGRARWSSSPAASRRRRWRRPRSRSRRPPENFSILSVHKYVPAAMEIVAEIEETQHRGVHRRRPRRDHHRLGDLRAVRGAHRQAGGRGRVRAARHPRGDREAHRAHARGRPEVFNVYPRCVTREGNLPAQRTLWRVFRPVTGQLARHRRRCRTGTSTSGPSWRHLDARRRFRIDTAPVRDAARGGRRRAASAARSCSGSPAPTDCAALRRRPACPSRRWAPAWCPPRGSAASGTPTAASRTSGKVRT